MKTRLALLLLAGLAASATPVQAAQLSPERLDVFDRRGYFTPAAKQALQQLIEARQATATATKETRKIQALLPALKEKAIAAEAKTAVLRQELASYEHPDEIDYTSFKAHLDDKTIPLSEQIQSAQAYVWAYPASVHAAEMGQTLQQLRQKEASEDQAARDADAARVAARASLQQRAMAKQLSLVEWKDFLRDMSQEDVLKNLGRPQSAGDQFWIYRGNWTTDPVTQQKVGLMVSFNGSRVNSVTEAPPDYRAPDNP